MSKILFITPMWYEEVTPHDVKVCVQPYILQEHLCQQLVL